MHKHVSKYPGFVLPRVLLAFALCSLGVVLSLFSFRLPAGSDHQRHNGIERARYMPEPGGKADDFDRMEAEWFTRVTYPTGIFNSEWLRLAAAADSLIPRAIPA